MSNQSPRLASRLAVWMLGLAALLFLSGCASASEIGGYTQQVQIQRTTAHPLAPGVRIGQTFKARFDGLQTISVHVQNQPLPQGQLILRLFSVPQDLPLQGNPAAGIPLAESAIDLSSTPMPGFVSFPFAPLGGSSKDSYYLELQSTTSDNRALEISAGPVDAYLDGALYLNGQPDAAQLAFHLTYDPVTAAVGYSLDLFTGLGWIVISLALVLLPGWALLELLPAGLKPVDLTVRLGLAAGVGFAIYPLLLEWSWASGLKPGALLGWLPPLAAAIVLIIQRKPPEIRLNLPGSLAVLLLILLALSRSAAVLGLPAPLWGDSYQHSLITQLILDHEGLFQSWEPYSELTRFTYHFGFHSYAAALSWVSGLPAPQAVLWAGQAASLLSVLALAPLAEKLAGTAWAAPAVVLLTGLLSPMPAFYTNWGRYTQLAGQVILPVFLWLSASILTKSSGEEHTQSRWRLSLLLALAAAGLALTHVRVLILAALYPLAHAVLSLHLPERLKRYGWLAAAAISGAVLSLPWLINSFGSRLAAMFVQQVSTPLAQVRQVISEINLAGSLALYLPTWLWILLLISLAWAAWRHRVQSFPLLGWLALALLAANPQWLELPGAAIVGAYTAYIAAYIPLGIAGGAWLGSLVEWLEARWSLREIKSRRALRMALVLVVLAAAGLGMFARLDDVRPAQFSLVTYPDLRAARWVQANLPPQARILVNAFPAFYGSSVVGADAGWWLPLLAERHTTLPPLNYALEDEPYPGYRQTTNLLVSMIQERGPDDSETLTELRRQSVTHVFIGQRQGGLNNPYPPLLDPAVLAGSPHFRLLYRQDQVWVFEVLE